MVLKLDSEEWQQASNTFRLAAEKYQKDCDDLWNSLPYDDRLKLFCAISKLIYEGEIKERGTYRHVLYSTFGFGPDSYAAAQFAGFLAIHNAIFDGESEWVSLTEEEKHKAWVMDFDDAFKYIECKLKEKNT